MCHTQNAPTFQDQLRSIAASAAIGAFGSGTGGLAADQAHILDALAQAMDHHRIVPLQPCRDLIGSLYENALVALLARLRHPVSLRLPSTLSRPRLRLLKCTARA